MCVCVSWEVCWGVWVGLCILGCELGYVYMCWGVCVLGFELVYVYVFGMCVLGMCVLVCVCVCMSILVTFLLTLCNFMPTSHIQYFIVL